MRGKIKELNIGRAEAPYMTAMEHALTAEEELKESYTGGTVEVCIRHSTRAAAHASLALFFQNENGKNDR